jgi:alcohol dehydrogenase, propanol-preferring
MRALKLIGRGQIAIKDVEIPSPGPGEVLVKVAGAGLCHSDLHVVYEGDFPVKNLTLGHETAGTVAELGNGVAGLETGDPVLVYLVWACGTCRACVQGRDNACMKAVSRMATPPCPGLGPDGGMADFISVPARFLEPLGDLDPRESGPLADAGLTPMHAINGARHRLTPGSTCATRTAELAKISGWSLTWPRPASCGPRSATTRLPKAQPPSPTSRRAAWLAVLSWSPNQRTVASCHRMG